MFNIAVPESRHCLQMGVGPEEVLGAGGHFSLGLGLEQVRVKLCLVYFVSSGWPWEHKVCLPAWLRNAGSYLYSLFSSDQSHLWVGLTLAALCLPKVGLLHRKAFISE